MLAQISLYNILIHLRVQIWIVIISGKYWNISRIIQDRVIEAKKFRALAKLRETV